MSIPSVQNSVPTPLPSSVSEAAKTNFHISINLPAQPQSSSSILGTLGKVMGLSLFLVGSSYLAFLYYKKSNTPPPPRSPEIKPTTQIETKTAEVAQKMIPTPLQQFASSQSPEPVKTHQPKVSTPSPSTQNYRYNFTGDNEGEGDGGSDDDTSPDQSLTDSFILVDYTSSPHPTIHNTSDTILPTTLSQPISPQSSLTETQKTPIKTPLTYRSQIIENLHTPIQSNIRLSQNPITPLPLSPTLATPQSQNTSFSVHTSAQSSHSPQQTLLSPKQTTQNTPKALFTTPQPPSSTLTMSETSPKTPASIHSQMNGSLNTASPIITHTPYTTPSHLVLIDPQQNGPTPSSKPVDRDENDFKRGSPQRSSSSRQPTTPPPSLTVTISSTPPSQTALPLSSTPHSQMNGSRHDSPTATLSPRIPPTPFPTPSQPKSPLKNSLVSPPQNGSTPVTMTAAPSSILLSPPITQNGSTHSPKLPVDRYESEFKLGSPLPKTPLNQSSTSFITPQKNQNGVHPASPNLSGKLLIASPQAHKLQAPPTPHSRSKDGEIIQISPSMLRQQVEQNGKKVKSPEQIQTENATKVSNFKKNISMFNHLFSKNGPPLPATAQKKLAELKERESNSTPTAINHLSRPTIPNRKKPTTNLAFRPSSSSAVALKKVQKNGTYLKWCLDQLTSINQKYEESITQINNEKVRNNFNIEILDQRQVANYFSIIKADSYEDELITSEELVEDPFDIEEARQDANERFEFHAKTFPDHHAAILVDIKEVYEMAKELQIAEESQIAKNL